MEFIIPNKNVWLENLIYEDKYETRKIRHNINPVRVAGLQPILVPISIVIFFTNQTPH